MRSQDQVARFVQAHEIHSPPAYWLLDLVAEVGEVASAANHSTTYGDHPDRLEIPTDEMGDVLFSLLALADALGVDTEAALEAAMKKYEQRIESTGSPSSNADR